MDFLIEQFVNAHPQQAAEVLETCTISQLLEFSKYIDEDNSAFLSYMSLDKIAILLENTSSGDSVNILNALSDMQVAAIILHMPPGKRKSVLQHASHDRSVRIHQFLEYDDTQVGYYVEKKKLVMHENNTVHQALNAISHASEADLPLYLVDSDYKLVGMVELVKLIKMRDQDTQKLKSIAKTKINYVNGSSMLENILDEKYWEEYRSIAVVGKKNMFLGLISIDIVKKKARTPSQARYDSSMEEYMQFSDMVWGGLNKFWATLK